jgi:hypothetical protein
MIQAKLKVGQPGDIYEKEADRMAEQVMTMAEPQVQRQPEEEERKEEDQVQAKPIAEQISPLIQRQPEEEEKKEEDQVQAKPLAEQITPLIQRQPEEEERKEEDQVQAKPIAEQISPLIQREPEEEKKEEGLQAKEKASRLGEVSSGFESRINSIKGGGQPLSQSTRAFFEPRFGYNFGDVRVHADSESAKAARSLNARAFTVGRNIAFGAGQHSSEAPEGKRLLAHELTHVVQQSGGRRPTMRSTLPTRYNHLSQSLSKTSQEANGRGQRTIAEQLGSNVSARISPIPQTLQLYKAKICGRSSTQFRDFPKTHITEIGVNLSSKKVSLTWTGPSASKGNKGPFRCSAGAGLCGLDCNDKATSKRSGSMCTPKGTRSVEKYACALSGYPQAKNATYFDWGRRVAIHYFPSVPSYPASHGCVRIASLHAARLIYDNSRKSVTKVNVSGTWKGSVCYTKGGKRKKR